MGINPNKKISFSPKCGRKALALSKQTDFQCQSCEFVFYMNKASATAVLISNPEGDLLAAARTI
jgi:NADH pyrophosphatase NudC (nudix superfamily)